MKNSTIHAVRQIIKLLEKQGQSYKVKLENGVLVTIVFSKKEVKAND